MEGVPTGPKGNPSDDSRRRADNTLQPRDSFVE